MPSMPGKQSIGLEFRDLEHAIKRIIRGTFWFVGGM